MRDRTNPNSCPYDDSYHGTAVSGIIAAEQNNEGIAGISSGAKIMPLKVTDSSSAYAVADLCDALHYAADNGARIVNMSLGSTSMSYALQDAINYAHDKGVVLIACSGTGGNGKVYYPAGCQNVIGVNATNNRDEISQFSNNNSSNDVAAPGESVYTTDRLCFGGYLAAIGTSFAAPHVAGLAALILSAKPSYTPLQVERAIEKYAVDLGTPGRDDYFGYGRIDAYATIKGVLTPRIDSLDPSRGPTNSEVTITGDSFGDPQGESYVSFSSSRAAIKSWANNKIVCTVPEGLSGTVPVTVTNAIGTSDAVDFQVTYPTWYLAEGSTAWGFEATINIENPNDSNLNARVTFMLADGSSKARVITLPKMSQTTINPKDDLGERDFSTKVECTDATKSIAVDRTMIWNRCGEEGHNSIGVTSPAKTWYLAEGSSAWNFECWLLIQNPNEQTAHCRVTYMIENEGPKMVDHEVPANSRATFNMATDIGSKDASIKVDADVPVIPERAMYRNNRREGHDSIGTTAPANDYYLAEGATGYNVGYITYVLVQNPRDTPTDITLTYLTGSGQVAGPSFQMPANSRKTVRLNDQLPPDTDVSTTVHGSKPIIAERAMYWDNGTGEACHDSIGMGASHTTFYLPDGQSSQGRETWTLVQNPNSSPVTVEISYLTPTGTGNVVKDESIPANSRKTFNMLEHSGINGCAAIMVKSKTAGKKIMVERAMYWNNRGAGTDTIGGYAPED